MQCTHLRALMHGIAEYACVLAGCHCFVHLTCHATAGRVVSCVFQKQQWPVPGCVVALDWSGHFICWLPWKPAGHPVMSVDCFGGHPLQGYDATVGGLK